MRRATTAFAARQARVLLAAVVPTAAACAGSSATATACRPLMTSSLSASTALVTATPTSAGGAAPLVQRRHNSQQQKAGGGADPKVTQMEARRFLKTLPRGVIVMNELNFDTEINQTKTTPLALLFYTTSVAEVWEYAKMVIAQVDALNREVAAQATESTGVAKGDALPAVKLGLIDVERNFDLAQTFRIAPDLYPMIQFVAENRVIDKMAYVVPEAHVAQAMRAFLHWANTNKGKPAPNSPEERHARQAAEAQAAGHAKPDRFDEHEENVMTLQQAAIRKLQNKDPSKAYELFTKARTLAEEKVKELKARLGVDKKKMTPEIEVRLKQDPNFMGLPQAICGQAMTRLSQKNYEEAYGFAVELRKSYAWAIKENRQIADTMCRIELIRISGFDPDHDNYVTLMRRDDLMDNPVEFYKNQMRLAVSHYFERHSELAIDELLRTVRMEPKIMSDLIKAGVIEPPGDGEKVTAQNKTPARRLLFLVFEALGNQHQAVIDARKKMQAFLHA